MFVESGTAEQKTEKLLPYIIQGTIFEDITYISGGYVRDEIKGIQSNDLDLVIQLEDGAKLFSDYIINLFGDKVFVEQLNINYPTYNIKFLDNIILDGKFFKVKDADVDVSDTVKIRFNQDSGKTKLYVCGNLQDDCKQRDFTINSLFKRVIDGKILDLTGVGIYDIKNNILRTISDTNADITFYNNPKTIIRLCRFFARYDMRVPQYVIDKASNNAYRINTLEKDTIEKQFAKVQKKDWDKFIYMMKKTDIYYFVQRILKNR